MFSVQMSDFSIKPLRRLKSNVQNKAIMYYIEFSF